MSASHVESWRNERALSHEFRGMINDQDLAMAPQEVIARVKAELVTSIVSRVMDELGPRLDDAIKQAWQAKS